MDWGNVSPGELADALREVEWSMPPRPLAECFQKFSVPKNATKWQSRVKCNIYYYRTNYFIVAYLALAFALIRRPLSLIAVVTSFLATASINDTFAISLSERIVRAVRKVSPPLAAKMRAPARTGVRGRPLRGAVYICGQDRWLGVAILSIWSFFLWYISKAYFTLLYSFTLGLSLILLHATFRSPNLKARLHAFREDFRAAWRGYSDAP